MAQSGDVVASSTFTYSYNDRAELTGADNNSYAAKDFTWAYDTMGKRTSANNNGSSTTYNAVGNADDDVNQYASITGHNAESGLAYDADGNLTEDGTWHYRYDGENRLREMEKKDGTQTLQFLYDYLGRRVRKTVRSGGPSASISGSTKFVWTGWSLLAELDGGTGETGTTLTKRYLWGADLSGGAGAGGLLAVTQAGVTYFPTYDAQGNVTGYLNAGSGGSVTAAYEYNPYGEVVASSGSVNDFAFGFGTQYTDRESGLVYYGLRYYSPKHGRFINRDPIEEAGGNDLYGFVANNPANRWDYLGLAWEVIETKEVSKVYEYYKFDKDGNYLPTGMVQEISIDDRIELMDPFEVNETRDNPFDLLSVIPWSSIREEGDERVYSAFLLHNKDSAAGRIAERGPGQDDDIVVKRHGHTAIAIEDPDTGKLIYINSDKGGMLFGKGAIKVDDRFAQIGILKDGEYAEGTLKNETRQYESALYIRMTAEEARAAIRTAREFEAGDLDGRTYGIDGHAAKGHWNCTSISCEILNAGGAGLKYANGLKTITIYAQWPPSPAAPVQYEVPDGRNRPQEVFDLNKDRYPIVKWGTH